MAATEDRVRLSATVYGFVQGVGFRYFVVREAGRLGLRGYVRNTPEGNVDVVAEGPRASLEQLVQKLWKGPDGAYVERVETAWGPAQGNYSGFHIRF